MKKLIAFPPLIVSLFAMTPVCAKEVIVTVDGRDAPWDVNLNPDFAFGNSGSLPPRYVGGFPLHPGSAIRIYAKGSVNVTVAPAKTVTQSKNPIHNRSRTADQLSYSEQQSMDLSKPREGHDSLAAGTAPPFLSEEALPPPSSFLTGNQSAPRLLNGAWGPQGEVSEPANGRNSVNGERYPSFYIDGKHYPVHVNELVGAFVNKKGALVSKPFPVARWVDLRVPDGAYAIALGLNSTTFGANSGTFIVLISDNPATVTVGPDPD